MAITYANGMSAGSLYSAIFGSNANQTVIDSYENGKATASAVAAAMWADASEGTGYASVSYDTNQLLVEAVYANVLGRSAADIASDVDGVSYWVNRLDTDLAADQLVIAVLAGIGAAVDAEGNPIVDAYTVADQAYLADELSEGNTYGLTSSTDRFVGEEAGTANNDTFNAYIEQNSFAGGVSNSLSSADHLDGGAGDDSLYAELTNEFAGVDGGGELDVQPRTTDIETVEIEARDDAAAVVTLDAKYMYGVEAIGSKNSDGDLVIENLTTLADNGETIRHTSEMTITMDHTDNFNSDGDASDLTVYFDEDYLNTTTQDSGSTLTINAINTLNLAVNDGSSLVEGFETITFYIGEEIPENLITVDVFGAELSAVQGLIQAAVDAAGHASVRVTTYQEPAYFGTNIYYEDTNTTYNAGDYAGQYTAFLLTNSGAEELIEGGFTFTDGQQDGSIAYSQDDREATTATLPISINIELEKVGRDGEGGDLIIGGKDQNQNGDSDVDQNDGINIFNITVRGDNDQPSNLGTITSTNNSLTTVTVDDHATHDGAELTVRGILGQGQELLSIDATGFTGDFSLAMTEGTQQALSSSFGTGNDSYDWMSVEAATNDDNGNNYTISMGGGNDTVTALLDGDSVDALGESFSLTTGDGNDTVTVDMTQGVSYETMTEIGDGQPTYLDINTGAGDDRVMLNDYGTFDIVTAGGADYIEIDANDTTNNSGTWTIFNSTGVDTFGARVLYDAQLTVSFAGFETTIDVSTVEGDNFVATQELIVAEIARAISEDDTLSEFLTVNIGAGTNQITITSDIDGANVLAISLFQPELVAAATIEPDQTQVQANDVAALRQGLLATETVAGLSADLENAAEIVAWTNNNANNWEGSVSQAGAGDNGVTYTAAQLTSDTAEAVQDDNADALDNAAFLGYTSRGTNDVVGENFSTIDAGADDDIIVLDSNVNSMNTIVVSGAFGYDRVVNFFDDTTDIGAVAANEVGDHIIDYSTYLTDTVDTSGAGGIVGEDNDSAVLADTNVILATNDRSFANVAHGAAPGVEIDANDVAVIRFDSSDANVTTETFDNLSGTDLVNALNGDFDAVAGGGDGAYANLIDATMSAVAQANYVNATQNHIIMIENDLNEGEYKVFHVTSTINTATDVVTDGDFTLATELGTFDFGASVNLAVSQEESVMTALQDAIDAATSTQDAGDAAAIAAAAAAATVDVNQAATAAPANTVVNANGDIVAIDTIKTITATLTATAAQAQTMSGVTGGITVGNATTAEAIAMNAIFSGVVTGTITDSDMATLNALTETGNAYTIVVDDAGVAASELAALALKTSVAVDATAVVTVTGTTAVITSVDALLDDDYARVVTDAAGTDITADALTTFDGLSGTGTLAISNAMNVTGLVGAVGDALDLIDTDGGVNALISDADITAAELATLHTATDGTINTASGELDITATAGAMVATSATDTFIVDETDTGLSITALAVGDIIDLAADLDVTNLDAVMSADKGSVAAAGDWFFDTTTNVLTYEDLAGDAQDITITGVATFTTDGTDDTLTVATIDVA